MYGKLLTLFLKLDFRDKDNSGKKKLYGIFIGYLFSSTAISFNYFINFDELSFIILSFTVNIFLLVFVVLTDYNNLFFSKNSIDVIKNLPVEQSGLFFAKYTSALIYITFFTITNSLPQTVFFYFYQESIYKSILFLIVNFSFIIFSTTFIILIYTLLLKYLSHKSNYLIYIFQIIFVGFVMYSSSLASKAYILNKKTILDYKVIDYLPQTFFAQSINSSYNLIISFSVTVLLILVLFALMKSNYYKLSDIINSLDFKQKKEGGLIIIKRLNNFVERLVLRNGSEKASFGLIKNHLKNSKNLRIKYIPLIFIPIGFCLIGVLTGAKKFLIMTFSEKDILFNNPPVDILSPSISMMLLLCIRLLISNTKISDENTAGMDWLYSILPIDSKMRILMGVQKFLHIYFIIPVIILSGIILSFKINFYSLLLNLIYITSAIFFINSLYSLFDKKFPLTEEYTKYNSASRLLEILITVLLGIVIFVGQIFIFQNVIFIVIVSLVLLTVSYFLTR